MKDKIHIPVLIKSIIDNIEEWGIDKPKIVDATLGLGGYIKNIIKVGIGNSFLGIDCDESNMLEAKKRLEGEKINIKFNLGNFRDMSEILKENQFEDANIFLFDLGLCSTHVDDQERGFSFQAEGPLDMRFSKKQANSAYDFINFTGEHELADNIYKYGEERLSRHIASEIIRRRKIKKIETTKELADLIESVYGYKGIKRGKRHPATKTFQALRIAVNDELSALEQGLSDTIGIAKKGSRIFVISYHSLEDRLVKNIFREAKKEGKLRLINKKVIIPDALELKENPRSRSAKLRIVEIN